MPVSSPFGTAGTLASTAISLRTRIDQPLTRAHSIFIFVLLARRFPFTSTDAPTIRREAKAGPIEFPPRPWNAIGDEAKDLIRRLLVYDPAQRLTAQQALDHPVRLPGA